MSPTGARGRAKIALRTPLVVAFTIVLAACSQPNVGHDRYEAGRHRVVALLNAAGDALPAHSGFRPVALRDTDRELCHKHVLGYAYARSGTRQPEVSTFVDLRSPLDPDAMIARLAAFWARSGYRVDRSEQHRSQFGRIRAHHGDYTLIVTSFKQAPAFRQRLSLYVVGACQRD